MGAKAERKGRSIFNAVAFRANGLQSSPWRDHLVLAGGGHTHALVLRRWFMDPRSRPPATRITLVSRQSSLCYSGRVPAVLAGLTPPETCRIDLRRLCALADVAFILAEIQGLDACTEGRAGALRLEGRPPLPFDRLSLDVGAITPADAGELPVKPLEPLLAWSTAADLQEPRLRGGGASAVEVALALRARGRNPELLLRGTQLHLGSAAANRHAERLLQEAGISIQRRVKDSQRADLACTGSHAPRWLASAGLPIDLATGRVLTETTLQVCGHAHIFACGDCALVAAHPRPASGVWAVRAAPVLATNLSRSLANRPLRPWRPQRWALQLLGDGGLKGAQPRALAFWGPLALGPSPWLWRWKQHLDQRFMANFAALAPMAPAPMACRGCAAKLPAHTLRRALGRLADLEGSPLAAEVEDAPLVHQLPSGEELLQSVDGFPALVADPWLNARLTTLHACSDLWASGAEVWSAQVVVTLPEASSALQEDLLLQTLAGVRSVLDPLKARLLGGHTLEARDGAGLSLSLTINGLAPQARHWGKGPLREGDALLLSRPIGSGVLFAAAMLAVGDPHWMDGALAVMQQSQAALVKLLAARGCQACTDITGFGLLGHLGEMLASSAPNLLVDLDTDSIPAFPGSLDLLAEGFASSLAPANAEALTLIGGQVRWCSQEPPTAALQALLIDPQTCGPLLAALPQDQAAIALQELQGNGFAQAAMIGRVRSIG